MLTTQYKRGILNIAVLIGLLCFFVFILKLIPVSESEFLLNEEEQCFIENQKLIQSEPKKQYTYYVNSISDFGGYQLGLSVSEINNLLSFREKGNRIYDLKQFQEITGINNIRLDSIKHLLVFPRKKKIIKKNTSKKKKVKKVSVKRDINTVSSQELYARLKFPSKIANRIINYRKSLTKFEKMEQLKNVYDISNEQIEELNTYYEIKK